MKVRKNVKNQSQQSTEVVKRASLLNKEKIWAIILIISIIVTFAVAFGNKNALKNSMHLFRSDREKIGENAEVNLENAPNETVGATSVDTSKWDMTRVNAVADTEGEYVPVPKGFVASGATGEHTVSTGFVIYEGDEPVDDTNAWDESCTRNQFVWVPVPDTTRVYEEIGTTEKKKGKLWEYNSTGKSTINNNNTDDKCEPGILPSRDTKQYFTRYGMTGYTREQFYQELATSFDRDMESIKKYGGFYIGRYETGNITSEQPVVQRMNTTISNQTWYAMYPRMKNISTNKNVEISMIWGCLWDETLHWFIKTKKKTQAEVGSDSTEWGNYLNATFTYTNTSGGTSTKNANSSTRIPTGSTERNKANNIYDMAGNVWDWTLEGSDSYGRYLRGGYYENLDTAVYPVRYRYSQFQGSSSDGFGFRVHLCVKI